MSLYFDIETSPLPEAELQAVMPKFEAPSNYKDEAKIKAVIEEKKKAWLEDAALDPITGRVLCVGLLLGGKFTILDNPEESQLLGEFWGRCVIPGRRLIGFNILLFDLPFLIRRSWKHNILPLGIRKGRYWNDDLVDLRELWQMGDRQAHGGLDLIAKHLGLGAKSGNGKDFAKLWATDKSKAIAYLENDLRLTAAIAQRMGIADYDETI
jgi:Predicted 3''-5'' exonuclease related to the exonuclease domain of PolB.